MTHRDLALLIFTALLTSSALGCGASQLSTQTDLSPGHISGGLMAVDSADPGLWEIHPAGWPVLDVEPPLLGVATSDSAGRLGWLVSRTSLQPSQLTATRVSDLPEMLDSKLLIGASLEDDGSILLAGGYDVSVQVNDIFFMLDDPTRGEPSAWLVVTDVEEEQSRARVVHSRRPLEQTFPGTAVFMQLVRDTPERLATVAITGLSDHPELRAELSAQFEELVTEFQQTNLALAFPDAAISPAAHEINMRSVEQELELEGNGHAIFVEVGPDSSLVQISGFGPELRANLIGILPGGLRLEFDADDTEELARHLLAISFPAALVTRNDEAAALYISYYLLDQGLNSRLVYHLREQLAMRYDALGRSDQALMLMGQDIDYARESGDAWVEQNAVSIRSAIYGDLELHEQQLQDATRYLELAREADPESPLYSERLHVAIAMRSAGHADEARDALEVILGEVSADPDASADALMVSALHFALSLAFEDRQTDALLVHTIIDRVIDQLSDEQRASSEILRLELLLSTNDLRALRSGISRMSESIPTLRNHNAVSSLLMRLAGVAAAVEDPATANMSLIKALDRAIDDYNFLLLAEVIKSLSSLKLNTAFSMTPEQAAQALAEAHQGLSMSADLLLELADYEEATELLMLMAFIDISAYSPASAIALLDRAEQLVLSTANSRQMLELLQLRARIAQAVGDDDSLRELQEAADIWAEFARIPAPRLTSEQPASDQPGLDH